MRFLKWLFLLLATPLYAQSTPGFITGQTPTATQWNNAFAAKQDFLGVISVSGLVLNTAGCSAPCQSGATQIANGAALQAALTASGTNNQVVQLPCASIEYNSQTSDGGIRTGLQLPYTSPGMAGCGSGSTRLIQYANNWPAFTMGSVSNAGLLMQRARVGGFALGFGADQAGNTNGNGLVIGNVLKSSITDIVVDRFASGSGPFRPYIGWYNPSANSIGQFENWFNEISVDDAAHIFWEFDGNTTGSTFGVVYLGGTGNFFVDYRLPDSNVVQFNNCTSFGVIHELNIEWIQSPSGVTSGQLLFNNCRGGAIDQVRFEGNRLTGASPNLIGATLSNVSIQSLNLYNVTIASGDISGTAAILGTYEDSHVSVDNGNWQWNTFSNGTGAATGNFQLFASAGTGDQIRQRITFRNIYMVGNASGTFSFDSTLPAATVQNVAEFSEYQFNPAISTVRDIKTYVVPGTTAWTLYGWAVRPQVVVDFALAAGLTITWEDTWGAAGLAAALPTGSPDILQLLRTGNATGAFNVLLKNHAGTTITTQGSASTTNNITRSATTLTNF